MSKSFKCSNCGSSTRQKIGEGQYQCVHCDTLFEDNTEERISKAVKEARQQTRQNSKDNAMASAYNYANKTRRTILIAMIIFFIVGGGIAFYMTNKAIKAADEQREKITNDIQKSINSANQ